MNRLITWVRNIPSWPTAIAYKVITRAMRRNKSYANTWQANIACPLMDEGMTHSDANRAADRLMQHLFGVQP